MFCALSGEIPVEPLASKISGHVFEKRLIEKVIADSGKCPITGLELTENDLLSLKVNKAVRPRPAGTSGIAGLLTVFQNEWDELMLESFTLKQNLDSTRQELAQTLYQQDAACRVIARVMKERDEARAALKGIEVSGFIGKASRNGSDVDSESPPRKKVTVESSRVESESSSSSSTSSSSTTAGLTGDVKAKLEAKCAELSAWRRSRKPVPEGSLSRETIGSISQIASFTPHKSNQGGIASISVSRDAEESYILTSGLDKDALITLRNGGGKVVGKLSGHAKKVNDAAFHPDAAKDAVFTASADKKVKVWRPSGVLGAGDKSISYKVVADFDHHFAEVSAIAVQPTGDFLVSVSLDGSWAFLDVSAAVSLLSVPRLSEAPPNEEYLACQFHPDGLILGTGSGSGAVRLWDVRDQSNAAAFTDHSGAITALSFSENGYLLVSSSTDGTARVWDLRKRKCVKEIGLGVGPVSSVAFDFSGLYMAVAGETGQGGKAPFDLQVFAVKDWTPVSTLTQVHTKTVSGVAWGRASNFLCSASLDRVVRIYAPSTAA